MNLVNSSVSLIGDVTNKIPIYGSIVNTATTGITSLISSFKGNREKELITSSAKMLPVLNSASQFSFQKSIIDNDWKSIATDLKKLEEDHIKLLAAQIEYYELSKPDYDSFLNETTEGKKDIYKNNSRVNTC